VPIARRHQHNALLPKVPCTSGGGRRHTLPSFAQAQMQ
jgi:hypothetical protein